MLSPGESRTITMRLHPGDPFTRSDVQAASDRTIRVAGYANETLIGGNSYVLDPAIDHPQRPPHRHHDHHHECTRRAEDLIDCLELEREKVRRVRLRKVTVDIEFEDEC